MDEQEGRCGSQIGKRVAKSTIEAEGISLGQALGMAVFLREVGWKELSNDAVRIVGRTDTKTLES